MDNRFEQLINELQISSSPSNVNLDEITCILQKQNSELLPSFISESYPSILILEQWVWKVLTENIQRWVDKADYLQLFQTLAVFNKCLIFSNSNIEANMKAALLIPETDDCINRIFEHLGKLHDENHPYIRIVSLWFDNISYFLRENPHFDTRIAITTINHHIVRNYVMTDQYKYYLTELRESSISQSIFTAKQLFYIKTCSLSLSTYLFSKMECLSFTVEEIIQHLAVDYPQIMIQHTYMIESWSQEFVGCITFLCCLFGMCYWWLDKKGTQRKFIFPTETAACEYVDALIRVISCKTLYQFITPQGSNDQTTLLQTSLFSLLNIGDSQHFIWFLRSKVSLPETLVTLAETSTYKKISLCVYAVLGEILTDQQLKDLKVSDNVIVLFFTILEKAWHHPSKQFKQVSISALLKAFVTLSKIDVIQQKTADTNKVSLLIEMSDQCPIVYDILWSLSFNHDIQQQLRANSPFMTKLAHLPKKCNNEEMRKITHGILWNLESDHEDRTAKGDEKAFDIMISYSHKDDTICRRIHQELVKAGYRIWIDFDQMHGNVMDSMAQGIEQSKMVLVCMSEQYRRSNYCRAEAHYAFRHQLHIVPVLVQEHYKPDGWLLFLVGHLLYVNFGKHEFARAMEMLMAEVKTINLQKDNTTEMVSRRKSAASAFLVLPLPASTSPPPSSSSSSSPSQLPENILNWTQTHVRDWLVTHQLVQMSHLLSSCNGRSLVYFHDFIKSGNKEEILSLLKSDSVRLTNGNFSLVELACFQSLMDEQRNLVESMNPGQHINIEKNKKRRNTHNGTKKKDCLLGCQIM